MNAATDITESTAAATAIAGIDVEIERLVAERDALIAATAPNGEGDSAKVANARQALAGRLFGVRLPAGTTDAQVAAFAETSERFDDLADELSALGVEPVHHAWRAGGAQRRALDWTLDGITYSLHSPRHTGGAG